MRMHEDFHRCLKCNHPWFVEKTRVVLHESSTTDEVVFKQQEKTYVCESCETPFKQEA